MKMLKHGEGGTYMYYAVDDDEMEDLQHHGIRGQKWGIRRFQNPDGTRTAAGKRREREDSSDAQNDAPKKSIDKKTVAKVAIGALAVGGTAFLIANPTTRDALAKYGKTAVSGIKDKFSKENLKEAGKKVGDGLKETGKKFGKKLSERAEKVGDAMIDAALLSVGGIAIAKVNQKFAEQEGDSESTKNTKQVVRDTLGAGIKTAAGGGFSSSGNGGGNKGGSVGKEISEKIGAPSNKGVDKQSPEYQNLFKGKDADTRSTIKAMASAGYDINQIDQWLNHGEFAEWNESFVFSEFRW
jgi:hypothetical protein